jgi:ribokinase
MDQARVGVVGHVEWVTFAVTPRLPRPGEILPAREVFELPAGGGGVAAVQLARLAGHAAFLTSVGSDDVGARTAAGLRALGVEVHAAKWDGPQRRAFTYLTDDHERTITVLGERHVPSRRDALPWDDLARFDGIYFTGGDAAALRAARAARYLVATPRALDAIRTAGVELDVLVASATDAGERVDAARLEPRPRHVVLTRGAGGGTWEGVDGTTGSWAAAEVPGPPVDAFGCGDTFAAALTFGLADGRGLQGALELAAICGARVLAGRGPYGADVTAPD